MSAPWEIIPHVGVGPVRFGMTRHEVQAAMGTASEEFERTPQGKPADKFRAIGAFAYYASDGRLESVEFARTLEITLRDLNLTTTPTEQLLRVVLLLDPDVEIAPKSSGFLSRRLGAGVWTEGYGSEPPQAVIAFAKGYYD